MNIQKHLVRLFLVVIVGSNSIDSFWLLACRFSPFRLLVRDRFSCQAVVWRGFILGKIDFILSRNLVAHLFGFLQRMFSLS